MLLACLAYANSFDASFQFDDDHVIQFNPGIRGLHAFWQHLAFQMNRPLLFLSFTLNYMVGGLDPTGYHVVNLALHLANAALVAILSMVVLTGGCGIDPGEARRGAWLAAALFAVHPAATEAVTYISSRSSLLVTTAYLISVLAALRSLGREGLARSGLRGLSLLSFVAAMATKELALSLPLMLPFVLWVLPWPGRSAGRVRDATGLVVALVALFVAAASLRVLIGPVRAPFVTWSLESHLLTQAGSWPTYLRIALLPVGLNVDHDVPLAQGWGLRQTAGTTLLVVAAMTALLARRRRPWVSFALGWFGIALAPTCLIPLQDHIAERRLYLPMAGACVGLSLELVRLARRARPAWLGWVPIGLLLTLGVVGTHVRNRAWQDPETLWSDAARKSPHKARPEARLGHAMLEAGRETDALVHLGRALELDPDDVAARRDRIAILRAAGRIAEAEADAVALARVEPDRPGPWQLVAELALERGDAARALDVLRENELREPLQRDTLLTEARAWVALGRPERARAVLERSMRRWPDDAREQRALGYLELGLGRTGPARAAFERALELEPGSREAMDRLEDLSREASEDVQS